MLIYIPLLWLKDLGYCNDELLLPNEERVRIGDLDPTADNRLPPDLPIPKNLLCLPLGKGVADVVAAGAGPSL